MAHGATACRRSDNRHLSPLDLRALDRKYLTKLHGLPYSARARDRNWRIRAARTPSDNGRFRASHVRPADRDAFSSPKDT